MKKLGLLVVLFLVFILTGCTQQVPDAITNKLIDQLDQERMVVRDNKRIADANWILTSTELYFSFFNKAPFFKDAQGNLKSLNLIKGSKDYMDFQSEINKIDEEDDTILDIPTDPLDSNRPYVYYSDGDKTSVTIYLENEQLGCKLIKQNYCELKKTNN